MLFVLTTTTLMMELLVTTIAMRTIETYESLSDIKNEPTLNKMLTLKRCCETFYAWCLCLW